MNLKIPTAKYFKTKGATESIRFEYRSKNESEHLYKQWDKGTYNFLHQRTLNNFNKSKTKQRRNLIINIIEKDLPHIDDDALLWLYQEAVKKHRKLCSSPRFDESGYQDTPSEISFRKNLESIIESDPKYSHLEVYPSSRHSKDLPANQKMTIGVLIPDFIVYGIKQRGYSAVCFEINGDSHVYKYGKDKKKEQLLQTLGVATLTIENNRTRDYQFIRESIDPWLKKRSGSLDKQQQRNKRKIWTKTVACQFTLSQIEELIRNKFNVNLNLLEEARELVAFPSCPRNIKKELKNVL